MRYATIPLALLIPALALPTAAHVIGCDITECVKHSDCGTNGLCDDGDCVSAAGTGTDDGGGEVGGGDCQGYTFEAPDVTISAWVCVDEPLDYPLADLTLTPVVSTPYADVGELLHEAGTCAPLGSPTVEKWDTYRMELAESVFWQCMPFVLGQQYEACTKQAEGICTAAAEGYYDTIPSIPPLTQVQGILFLDGPCEGGFEWFCQGGLDEDSGG